MLVKIFMLVNLLGLVKIVLLMGLVVKFLIVVIKNSRLVLKLIFWIGDICVIKGVIKDIYVLE